MPQLLCEVMDYRKNILAGMGALFITMGVARFLYTPLMPMMQLEQGFGDIWGGTLGTTNFSGYLVGALIATTLPARWKLNSYRTGLVLALLSTPMMVFHDWPSIHLASRFMGGLAGALAMISGSSLLMLSLPKDRALVGMGLHFSGVGIGIVLTGASVILLGNQLGADGLWLLAAIACLPLGVMAWIWMPKPPVNPTNNNTNGHKIPWHALTILMLLIYFIDGAAYVIDATFLVRIFLANPNIAPYAEWSWVLLGLAAIPSTYGWTLFGRKFGHLKALLGAFIIQTIGIILPVVLPTIFGALFGALLFGATFLGIVALVMSLGGKLVPDHPARLMGLFTIFYSITQMMGPITSGWMLEHFDNPDLPLWVAGGLSLICVILTLISTRLKNQPT